MVLALAFGSLVSTLAGGVVALRYRDWLHLLLGFTAGVILGVVAFDLLPEVFRLHHLGEHGVPTVMLTFAAGFLVLHVIERTSALHHGHEESYGEHRHPHVGIISALALAAHSFMDGIAIGLASKAGTGVAIAVALAVIGHDFADGLNTVGVVLAHGNSARRSALLLAVDACAPVLGAASTLFFTIGDRVLALYLGFFAGFLLYLATADILPEAHSRRPSRLTLVCTFAGVVAMWGLVSVIG